MKLVFATNNQHKLQEVRQILGDRFEVMGLADIGCHEDIPETAETLEGNALQKARYVKEHYDLDCFADDTGLEVRALNGAPGVHTARYAELFGTGETHDSNANMNLLLRNLENKTDRHARFRTVFALIYQGEEHFFEGIVEGEILHERHGSEGFGYDPVFEPEGRGVSFAEMSANEKNAISHRGRATQKLVGFLKKKLKG
ncbi:MAG: non-canonical purine NTP diphosphatase [Bacteroidaceae bacterium]|nr:non-canonical purine NTP diphosphatase [Bacteroidaceae bacterium]